MNDKEFGSFKFLKLKYRKRDQIIQLFCRIGSPPQEIRFPFFNLKKVLKTEKSTAESCRIHWNLINDKEFGSFKFLELKYRRGDQIILPFCRAGPPIQKIRSPFFNLRKFKKNDKRTAESCKTYWNLTITNNLGPSNFPNWNTEEGTR